jgi:hypothetical protein
VIAVTSSPLTVGSAIVLLQVFDDALDGSKERRPVAVAREGRTLAIDPHSERWVLAGDVICVDDGPTLCL